MKKIVAIILLFFIYFALTVSAGYAEADNKSGSIKLKTEHDELYSLNGTWEFYWNELLEPEDFKNTTARPSYISVPSSWENQVIDGERLTSTGYGTYRLKFYIPKSHVGQQKALSFHYVGSSYRIWINEVEYEGAGVVGKSLKEQTPILQRNIVFFETNESVIEIVIQVSNFSFREGGIIHDIFYGDPDPAASLIMNESLFSFFTIGALWIIGLYHLFVFAKRKNEPAILFIALSSFALSLRTFTDTEYAIMPVIQIIGWERLVEIEYLSGMAFFIFLVLTVKHLFPKEVHRLMVYISIIVAIMISLFILVTPSQVFTSFLPHYYLILVVLSCYYVFYVGILAIMRKKEGAILHIVGAAIIVFAVINDVLRAILIINTVTMTEFAFILFIMLQAVIISNRYIVLFKENESLTRELLDLTESLENKIEERTEKIRQKNNELVELQQSRTKLLANIAHDMGTPLVGVQTYLQIMKEGKVNIDVNKVIPQLMDELSYIRRLNNDLFDLSKLESNNLPFKIEKVKIKDYFAKLFHHMLKEAPSSQSTQIQINRFDTVIHGEEAFIEVDKFRIRQVLENYIGNAIKFSKYKNEETRIILNCYIQHRKYSGHKEVIVEVIDNGSGIDDDEADHIFERFYKKREGNMEGSGLGLAIVKEIVEQHGGRVGVESEIGIGSCFYFCLPVSQ